jgi:hypothetical protein
MRLLFDQQYLPQVFSHMREILFQQRLRVVLGYARMIAPR